MKDESLGYCGECGSNLEMRDAIGFNPDTGEKSTRKVCSKDPCGHSYHDFEEIKPDGILQTLNPLRKDMKCKHCGLKWWSGEY